MYMYYDLPELRYQELNEYQDLKQEYLSIIIDNVLIKTSNYTTKLGKILLFFFD